MSSGASPLLVGFFAVGLLLTLIWVVSATYRRVKRFRLERRNREDAKTTSETWIDRPRVPDEKLGERSSPTTDADPTGLGAPKVGAGRITDNARQARELLEEAALEAKRTVVAAGPEHTSQQSSEPEQASLEQRRMSLDVLAEIQEADRKADELLLGAERQFANLLREAEAEAHRKANQITEDARQRVAEQLEEAEREARAIVVDTAHERALLLTELERERMHLEVERSKLGMPTTLEAAAQAEEVLIAAKRRREELLRESEAEAERKASEIADVARRQAEAVLERAELEATRIVAAAGEEHAQLVQALARERRVQEDTRTRLSAFLADMLAEVEAAPDTREGQANVRDLDEVRAVRKSAAGDS